MKQNYQVIIVGSGFSGICLGIHLKKHGIEDFIILERDPQPGGTWWRNSYPGAAVDVQSRLYSFSFEPWDWSRLFAKREEILAYTQHVYSKYGLHDHTACNSNVTQAVFREDRAEWEITVNDTEVITAPVFVNASGSLSQPAIPDFPGRQLFKGAQFHTSRWDNDYDHSGKKIAVIGTGASAIQVVPEIAKSAEKVYVLQRTPHWIMPRPDRALKSSERNLLRIPLISKLIRAWTYLTLEFRVLAFAFMPAMMDLIAKPKAIKNIKDQVADPDLQKKLIPSYRIGCKRILLSSEFYESLTRDNVELLTEGVGRIEENGIITASGHSLDVDLIVYATGFHGSEKNIPYPVYGRNGLLLQDHWKDGAFAYVGTAVSGFPNFFLMMGPNTGTGHTSVIYFIESQVKLLIPAIQEILSGKGRTLEVRKEVESEYNQKLQDRLKRTVWMTGGCHSWYLTKSGKNTTLFPTFSFDYRRYTSMFRRSDYNVLDLNPVSPKKTPKVYVQG